VNWEAVGAVAELLGALGVIVTLVYLGLQIRQNTVSTRTSSYQAAVATSIELTVRVGLDSDATRILTTGCADFAALSTEDQNRFSTLASSIFRNFENIFYQHKQGAIDDALWSGWSSRMRLMFALPGVQEWWPANSEGYAEDFAAHLESTPGAASNVDVVSEPAV